MASNPRNFYGTPSVGGYLPGVQYPGVADSLSARFADDRVLSRGNTARNAARVATSDDAVRSNQYNLAAKTDPVWDMMIRGTEALKSNISYAMETNDRARFDNDVASARKFRDEHIDEIRTIKFLASQHDDPQSQQIAQMADEWDKFTWLDRVTVGVPGRYGNAGTEVTAATYMRQDKPSDVAMRDYQFNQWAADAYVNPKNPWHQAFGAVLDAQKTSMLPGMAGAEGAKTPVAMQAKAFTGTYGRFLQEHHDRFADPGEAAVFGRQALQNFGFDLSSRRLDSLSSQWKAERDYNPSARLDDWMRARKAQDEAVRPVIPATLGTDGKPLPNAGQADPLVSREQMRAQVDIFNEMALKAGIRVDPTNSVVIGAIRRNATRRAVLERRIGFLPDSMNDCAARAAYGDVTRRGTDTRLRDLESVYTQACQTLGGRMDMQTGVVTDDPTDRQGALSGAAQSMSRMLTQAYIESGLDYDSFVTALRDEREISRFVKGNMVDAILSGKDTDAPRLDAESASELVDRYVGNFAQGKRESFYTMVKDLARYNLDAPEVASQPPVSLGALGDIEVAPENQASRIKAYDAVKSVVDGTSQLLASMKSDEDKAAIIGLAGDVLPRGYADKYVPSYESYANGGKVALYLLDRDLNLGDRIPADARKWIQTGDMFRFLTGEDKQVGFSQGDSALITMASSVAESLSKTLLTDQNLTSEEKAKLAGILIPVLASLPNRGGIFTEAPWLQQYSEALVQKVTGRKMYHQPTSGSSDLSAFYSRGARPIELSDNEADEFRTQLMQGTSSWLGTEVPDTMRLVGAPLKSIGKKDPIDMRGVLEKAMSGLNETNARTAVGAQDDAARAQKVEQGRTPEEADAERKGAAFRTYLARALPNDFRVAQFQDLYMRHIMRHGILGTDEEVKRLMAADMAEIEHIVRESPSYEAAYAMIKPYLTTSPFYVQMNENQYGFRMLTEKQRNKEIKTRFEAVTRGGLANNEKFTGTLEDFTRMVRAEQLDLAGKYFTMRRMQGQIALKQTAPGTSED